LGIQPVGDNEAVVIDDALQSWPEVAPHVGEAGLLLGNGASIAVWRKFAYRSLYARASSGIQHCLTAEDVSVFARLGTQNFEDVLRSLATASLVISALGHNDAFLLLRYASIHRALIEAVHSIHVPWSQALRVNSLVPIRKYLLQHKFVYSTNYDLMLYWSMAASGSRDLKYEFLDFIWNGSPPSFDRFKADVRPERSGCTRVHYLHGGLHLYRDPAGRTNKLVAYQGRLLSQFGTIVIPEYVAEGTWAQKMAKISQSDYLSFAFASFARHPGPLVVFGHSLDFDSDGHLVQAMRKWGNRPIAISIVPGDPGSVKDAKLKYLRLLPAATLKFFDARTHPLGEPALEMPVP
jgi:hypothetical protein